MIFDNCRRRISEITDAELKDLIGNQEENQWIEFKRQDYPTDPNDSEKRRNEICKDVTAMANAEGGYIFIGVQEKSGIAQDFCTIDKPDSIAQSINDICLQYITPRIQNLEVKQRSFEWNGEEINLVIIHIPPSGLRRHGFVCKNSTHFVKRYEDNIRYYPMSELVEAFRGTRERRSPISPEENALEQEDVRDLLHLMKLRFEEEISKEPYYRILAVPTTLNPGAVSTQESKINDLLRNPPDARRDGVGFRGVKWIQSFPEGIRGLDVWSMNQDVRGYEVVILRNGFLELRSPLSSTHFQSLKKESGISTDLNWLNPYGVCEYPVTFMRLVKAIYSVADIDSSIRVQQEYRNLSGFLLVGRKPFSPLFGKMDEFRHVYTEPHAIGVQQTIEPEFVPDQVAYDLVKEVYASFRLIEDSIPFFDENHNFVPGHPDRIF